MHLPIRKRIRIQRVRAYKLVRICAIEAFWRILGGNGSKNGKGVRSTTRLDICILKCKWKIQSQSVYPDAPLSLSSAVASFRLELLLRMINDVDSTNCHTYRAQTKPFGQLRRKSTRSITHIYVRTAKLTPRFWGGWDIPLVPPSKFPFDSVSGINSELF